MRSIAFIFTSLLYAIAQAQVAMPAQQAAAMRQQQVLMQRREMMARMAGTAMTAAMEGRTAQMTSGAARWAVGPQGQPVAAGMSKASAAYEKYIQAKQMLQGNGPFDNYAKQGQGSNQQGGGFGMDMALDLLAKTAAGIIFFVVFLVLLFHGLLCAAAAFYFAVEKAKQGYTAAREMIRSFATERGVLSRICAMDLSLSPTKAKVGSLQESLLASSNSMAAKVGALLSPRAPKQVSRTVPAKLFQDTDEDKLEAGKVVHC